MKKNKNALFFTIPIIITSILYSSASSANQSRPFKLSATAVQLLPLEEESFRNGTNDFPISTLAPHVDVVTIWPEYLGIPYDEFAVGPNISPSHPWVAKMNALISAANASGRPIMLELGLVRTGMVGKAWNNNGKHAVDDSWAPVCYDFSKPDAVAVGNAYVNYAQWMATHFQPAYLVNFIEANLYYANCGGAGAAWDALVNIQQRAHDAVKQILPNTPVFPSIHVETLYNYSVSGWDDAQYQALAIMYRDLFGLSIYPFGLTIGGGQFVTPYHLPADYIVRTKLLYPHEKLAITETGWNNTSINIGDQETCINNFPYSQEQFVADYLSFVLASAHYGKLEIVNWWSFRDEMPASVLGTCYPRTTIPHFELCSADPWCMTINFMKDVTYQQTSELFSELVLKAFGAMGLQSNDGTSRPLLMDRWHNELALPIRP